MKVELEEVIDWLRKDKEEYYSDWANIVFEDFISDLRKHFQGNGNNTEIQ